VALRHFLDNRVSGPGAGAGSGGSLLYFTLVSLLNDTFSTARWAETRKPKLVVDKVTHNRALTHLVGELATRTDAFRTRWAAQTFVPSIERLWVPPTS
jgi:hypothetical protein